MTDQHRATPEQWATQKAWAVDDASSSCILELRARVETLEAQYETMRQATLAWGKDVDNHSRWIDDHLKRIMALEAGQAPDLTTREQILKAVTVRVNAICDEANEQAAPTDTLVWGIAQRIARFASEGLDGDDATPVARAVVADVAQWLRRGYSKHEGYGTAWANRIEREANR